MFNVSPPATVLAKWEGVSVLRGQASIWLVCEQVFDPDCFDEALRLLGLTGEEDYEIIYDPGTGSETYIFDERDTQVPVQQMRDSDLSGVLPGLSQGGP